MTLLKNLILVGAIGALGLGVMFVDVRGRGDRGSRCGQGECRGTGPSDGGIVADPLVHASRDTLSSRLHGAVGVLAGASGYVSVAGGSTQERVRVIVDDIKNEQVQPGHALERQLRALDSTENREIHQATVEFEEITGCTVECGDTVPAGCDDVDIVDTIQPIISLVGSASVVHQCGIGYIEFGATASDTCDGDLSASIVTNNPMSDKEGTTGTYSVTYDVTDEAGNTAVQVSRSVSVEDTSRPIISLVGSASVVHQCGGYIEFGATASDTCDGDLSASIITNNPMSDKEGTAGTYSVTYDVTDEAGNTAVQVIRSVSVSVEDTIQPIISLVGNASVVHQCGLGYTDSGATASDTCDGDLSASITANNPVTGDNEGTVGTYSVTYDVTDEVGNTAVQVGRSVSVEDTSKPTIVTGQENITLGPTNGKYYQLDIVHNFTVTIDDICCGSDVVLEITSLVSNEVVGKGRKEISTKGEKSKKKAVEDIYSTSETSFMVNGDGTGDDRMYTINFNATDCNGQVSSSQVYVLVPRHNRIRRSKAKGKEEENKLFE